MASSIIQRCRSGSVLSSIRKVSYLAPNTSPCSDASAMGCSPYAAIQSSKARVAGTPFSTPIYANTA